MIYESKTRTLAVFGWSSDKPQDIKKFVNNFPVDLILYSCPEEWEPSGGFQESGFVDTFKFLISKNIKYHILLGAAGREYYTDEYKKILTYLDSYGKVSFFPFYFSMIPHISKSYREWYKYNSTEIKHLYYCMNNVPHAHRCCTIDTLHKYSLEKKGFFSWNIFNPEYNFKNWNQKITHPESLSSLEGYDYYRKSSYELPSHLYFESLFDLVTETSVDTVFLTEKTFKPLLISKPYIAVAGQGYYSYLDSLGFKSYEFIDYSFDSEPNYVKRVDLICQELIKLAEEDLNKIYLNLKPILEHNKKRTLELTKIKYKDLNFLDSNISNLFDTLYLQKRQMLVENSQKLNELNLYT